MIARTRGAGCVVCEVQNKRAALGDAALHLKRSWTQLAYDHRRALREIKIADDNRLRDANERNGGSREHDSVSCGHHRGIDKLQVGALREAQVALNLELHARELHGVADADSERPRHDPPALNALERFQRWCSCAGHVDGCRYGRRGGYRCWGRCRRRRRHGRRGLKICKSSDS